MQNCLPFRPFWLKFTVFLLKAQIYKGSLCKCSPSWGFWNILLIVLKSLIILLLYSGQRFVLFVLFLILQKAFSVHRRSSGSRAISW